MQVTLLDTREHPIETIELEVDYGKTYDVNDWLETPGGDRWLIASVTGEADNLRIEARWFDGPPGSPYEKVALATEPDADGE